MFVMDPYAYERRQTPKESSQKDYTSNFGKRHGGVDALVSRILLAVISIVFSALALVVYLAHRGTSDLTIASFMFSSVVVAIGTGLIMTFLYLKFRYALLALATTLVIVALVIYGMYSTL